MKEKIVVILITLNYIRTTEKRICFGSEEASDSKSSEICCNKENPSLPDLINKKKILTNNNLPKSTNPFSIRALFGYITQEQIDRSYDMTTDARRSIFGHRPIFLLNNSILRQTQQTNDMLMLSNIPRLYPLFYSSLLNIPSVINTLSDKPINKLCSSMSVYQMPIYNILHNHNVIKNILNDNKLNQVDNIICEISNIHHQNQSKSDRLSRHNADFHLSNNNFLKLNNNLISNDIEFNLLKKNCIKYFAATLFQAEFLGAFNQYTRIGAIFFPLPKFSSAKSKPYFMIQVNKIQNNFSKEETLENKFNKVSYSNCDIKKIGDLISHAKEKLSIGILYFFKHSVRTFLKSNDLGFQKQMDFNGKSPIQPNQEIRKFGICDVSRITIKDSDIFTHSRCLNLLLIQIYCNLQEIFLTQQHMKTCKKIHNSKNRNKEQTKEPLNIVSDNKQNPKQTRCKKELLVYSAKYKNSKNIINIIRENQLWRKSKDVRLILLLLTKKEGELHPIKFTLANPSSDPSIFIIHCDKDLFFDLKNVHKKVLYEIYNNITFLIQKGDVLFNTLNKPSQINPNNAITLIKSKEVMLKYIKKKNKILYEKNNDFIAIYDYNIEKKDLTNSIGYKSQGMQKDNTFHDPSIYIEYKKSLEPYVCEVPINPKYEDFAISKIHEEKMPISLCKYKMTLFGSSQDKNILLLLQTNTVANPRIKRCQKMPFEHKIRGFQLKNYPFAENLTECDGYKSVIAFKIPKKKRASQFITDSKVINNEDILIGNPKTNPDNAIYKKYRANKHTLLKQCETNDNNKENNLFKTNVKVVTFVFGVLVVFLIIIVIFATVILRYQR